jgi:hypothetical protein
MSAEQEEHGMSDEILTTDEDVEAHGPYIEGPTAEGPTAEGPTAEAADAPDVEAHGPFAEGPFAEGPTAEIVMEGPTAE